MPLMVVEPEFHRGTVTGPSESPLPGACRRFVTFGFASESPMCDSRGAKDDLNIWILV